MSWANDPGAGGLLVLPDNGVVTSYLQILVFGGLAVWTDSNRDGIGTQEEMQYLWQGEGINPKESSCEPLPSS